MVGRLIDFVISSVVFCVLFALFFPMSSGFTLFFCGLYQMDLQFMGVGFLFAVVGIAFVLVSLVIFRKVTRD